MMRDWLTLDETTLHTTRSIAATLTIPDESLFFAGHFPGRPVVPGIAMMAGVRLAVEEASIRAGTPRRVTGFRRLRFRKLIESGCRLRLHLAFMADTSDLLYEMHEGDDMCSDGIVQAPLAGDAEEAPVVAHGPPKTPGFMALDIETLIPHRDRMRVAQKIVHVEVDKCTTCSVVDDGWPLCVGGSTGSVVLTELVAQTSSAVIGWEVREHEPVGGKGFLVGVRKALWNRSRVGVGTPLTTRVNVLRKRANYAVFRGEVTAPDGLEAVVELQAFRP